MNGTFWTAPEIVILRREYPKGGSVAAAKALPGRSKKACHNMANRLGLHHEGDWYAHRKEQSPYAPEQKEAFRLARQRGFRVADIARHFGVSTTTVYKWSGQP